MKSLKKLFPAAVLLAMCLFASCGSEAPKEAEAGAEVKTETPAEKPEVRLTPFPASPEFSDATLDVRVQDNKFDYKVGGNYQLGDQTPDAPQKMCANSDQGQHIHLIVDDQPYVAKYEASFEHKVEDGSHYVLSFLSRSYHESIKNGTAHVAFKAKFQNGTPMGLTSFEEPMLFYSRPKGTYVGKADTEKVMLDFFLVNADLSPDGNKVKVEVNGKEIATLDEWKPYFIEGLPMGDNKVKLTLLGADGNPITARHNPVERVFTLKADPAE